MLTKGTLCVVDPGVNPIEQLNICPPICYTMIDVAALGQRIKDARELKGWSLGALGENAGISKSYLAKLERGEIQNPGIRTLHVIAVALGITLGDLLGKTPGAKTPIGEYERRLAKLPPGLGEFLQSKENQNEKIPADVIKTLASIQFRGKRPRSESDWQFVYDAIRRSISRP